MTSKSVIFKAYASEERSEEISLSILFEVFTLIKVGEDYKDYYVIAQWYTVHWHDSSRW